MVVLRHPSIFMTDAYIRAMFGHHAVHAAFNYVVQPAAQKENAAIVVGNTTFAKEMSFGGCDHGTHTLVLCDVIIRPRLVIASNHCRGMGATGILTTAMADADTWLSEGKVIIDMMPKG